MITVKIVRAPSQKIEDIELDKRSKPKKQKISNEKPIQETATYSTLIVVDGKYMSLSVTRHLGYQKPYHLDHSIPPPKGVDLFEELFVYPLEAYTNPNLNHSIYRKMTGQNGKSHCWIETNYYYQSGLFYELQWEEIEVERHRNCLFIGNRERTHLMAIPPNDSEEPRYDYITDDGHYKYGCKPGEYKDRAIEIIVTKL